MVLIDLNFSPPDEEEEVGNIPENEGIIPRSSSQAASLVLK
jgi:hypothetical protein